MSAASQTILLIEQDISCRDEVQQSLQTSGYKVLSTGRGLEGIDIARKTEPNLIITALDLPDLNGAEIATTLRAEDRFLNIPIIALLDAEAKDQIDLATAVGINGHLSKPVNLEALPISIQFYLSGGQDSIDDTQRERAARTRFLQGVVQRLEGQIRELETQNQKLKRLDHMKDTFIQLTAHELRTPLTLIAGYSRLLEDHPPLKELTEKDASITPLIEGLSESIGRMQGVIEEVLTISRIMTREIELSLKPTNLGTIVQHVLNSYKDALQQRKLTAFFDQSQWPISMRADGDLLRLALSNLTSNAIKYTPDGGNIRLAAYMSGKLLRFSIKDSGIGIDEETQKNIFERFHIGGDVDLHTTSKTAFRGGGLGLGLPICKGIIEAHGGRIMVHSSGHDTNKLPGSEFIVILPLIAKQQVAVKQTDVNRLLSQSTG